MNVIWLPRALRDLANIRAYIAKENPKAAKEVANTIRKTVALLKEHPYIGHPSDFDDVLEKQVVGLPYLIPYRVIGQDLQILRVFHEAQEKPPTHFLPSES